MPEDPEDEIDLERPEEDFFDEDDEEIPLHPIAMNYKMEAEAIGFVPSEDDEARELSDLLGWQFLLEWSTEYIGHLAQAGDERYTEFSEHNARSAAHDFLEFLHWLADVRELAEEEDPETRKQIIRRQCDDETERLKAYCDQLDEQADRRDPMRQQRREARRTMRDLERFERITGVRIVRDGS